MIFSIFQIFIEWNLPTYDGISELKNMRLPIFFILQTKLRNTSKRWGGLEVRYFFHIKTVGRKYQSATEIWVSRKESSYTLKQYIP